MKEIACFYVDKPHGVGVSQSWRVVGVDGSTYLIKFNIYPDRTAINELICNCIAHKFELPIFEPVIIQLNDEQCDIINEDRTTQGLQIINSGKHFGVKLIEPLYTVSRYAQTFGSPINEDVISNLHQVPDIFGFDTLIQNSDRHCENVCVMPTENTSKMFYYCIFDHSHAFGGPSWFAMSIKQLYENMQSISTFCLITSTIQRFEKFERFLRIFDECLKNEIDSIFEIIPTDWKTYARDDLNQLRVSIKNIHKDKLREIIKNSSLLGSVI